MAIGAVIRMQPAKKRASATASWPPRERSPDAAAEFFDQYATRIKRFIAHALGVAGESDADDLLQDTLIALAEALPYYRGESSLFTFACAIAHRKTMSHLRRAVRTRSARGIGVGCART
jgi:RNA polymerase sigma factor (sigma-70 family)